MKPSEFESLVSRFLLVVLLALTCLAGCDEAPPTTGKLEKVWGAQGTSEGRFQKPRAITIDKHDNLYIVDMTARIQVFTRDGEFLRSWQTPAWQFGRPCGLAFNRAGNLLVADTHYHRMLVYTPQGELLPEQTIGGKAGHGPGEFNFVTHAVEDSRGNYYIGEYGEYDRIQKFSPQGKYLFEWGGHGVEPGQFIRPQKFVFDAQDHLWVADACNHRIQVFDVSGDKAVLLKIWGEAGSGPGQLKYPYDLTLDGLGHVYVAEFGNSRVQKFDLDGQFLASWGTHGRRPGELFNPWSLVRDSHGALHILDTYNHRVQRVAF